MTGLPNFLIIGAARAGTTSIYHQLSSHQDVYMPVKKEPQYFTVNWGKGFEWYGSLFSERRGEGAVGEASVSYSYPMYEDAPKKIKEALPECRIIYILRNPVERTYSHYLYMKNYAMVEREEFRAAIEKNPVYLGASAYDKVIENYRNYFDEERMHIVIFERYVKDSEEALRKMFEFVGVDGDKFSNKGDVKTNESFQYRSETLMKAYRRFSVSRVRQAMEPLLPQKIRPHIRNTIRAALGTKEKTPKLTHEDRHYLEEYFRPHNSCLRKVLGDEIDIWKKE